MLMPLSGMVIEVNSELESKPELVNKDPYNGGWMIKIEISNPEEIDLLLSDKEYKELVG